MGKVIEIPPADERDSLALRSSFRRFQLASWETLRRQLRREWLQEEWRRRIKHAGIAVLLSVFFLGAYVLLLRSIG